MKNRLTGAAVLFLFAVVSFASCTKNSPNRKVAIHIRLGDAPADYSAVNIDLKEVQIKVARNASENDWLTLKTHAGIYNLLAYQRGADTLVATGLTGSGVLREMRLVLGTNNTLSIGDLVYTLIIPDGAESGLNILLDRPVTQPVETVTLDFDAFLSVRKGPDGFTMIPVIKVK
jgi:hypothetical protein